jgi:hypothetical protein
MKTIQVFDPALCCSTGVCGVEVDQRLVSFSADADWARQNGAQIERFNLAQQPMAFAENPAVKAFLERSGQAPLILSIAGSGRIRTEPSSHAGLALRSRQPKKSRQAGAAPAVVVAPHEVP